MIGMIKKLFAPRLSPKRVRASDILEKWIEENGAPHAGYNNGDLEMTSTLASEFRIPMYHAEIFIRDAKVRRDKELTP